MEGEAPAMTRQHYTLVCRNPQCQKIIMLTRNQRADRPVRYGLCGMCAPIRRWKARVAVCLLALLISVAAFAQSMQDRVDEVLVIGSLSMSSIALGLTMTCTTAGQCREANPVMARLFEDSPVRAVVVKSAINGAATYAAWRLRKGKKRTAILGVLFAVNAYDAIHNMRHMRKVDR